MLFCVLDEDGLCFYIQQIQGCKIQGCFSCLQFLLESLQILLNRVERLQRAMKRKNENVSKGRAVRKKKAGSWWICLSDFPLCFCELLHRETDRAACFSHELFSWRQEKLQPQAICIIYEELTHTHTFTYTHSCCLTAHKHIKNTHKIILCRHTDIRTLIHNK